MTDTIEKIERSFIALPSPVPVPTIIGQNTNTVSNIPLVGGGDGSVDAGGWWRYLLFSFLKIGGQWKWILGVAVFLTVVYVVNKKWVGGKAGGVASNLAWFGRMPYIKNDTLYITNEMIRDELSL